MKVGVVFIPMYQICVSQLHARILGFVLLHESSPQLQALAHRRNPQLQTIDTEMAFSMPRIPIRPRRLLLSLRRKDVARILACHISCQPNIVSKPIRVPMRSETEQTLTRWPVIANSKVLRALSIRYALRTVLRVAPDPRRGIPHELREVAPALEVGHVRVLLAVVGAVVRLFAVVPEVGDDGRDVVPRDAGCDVLAVAAAVGVPGRAC